MPRGKKKRPIEEKRAIELTDDEALEKLFGKEVRDKLKEFVQEHDRKAEESSHERSITGR
jgi:hypothetical protein